ncbi:hypothetical protein LTR62_008037 [Meristemomyces frigidus]|uniref:endo-1,3(4)-beta-glucanase n=1 Tax=Meristemomyces frigidus TaxID=1508187 RepID=A0AAN7YMC9_9PEZI|nr:hypothetical protein LTR62_008037 [Meristemomyces frigidus]
MSSHPDKPTFAFNRNDYHPPPDYKVTQSPLSSRWAPRNWNKKTWIGISIAAIILLVVIIVAAVVGSQNNAYPNYTALQYTLTDTYAGTDFFDNFDYFTGYDPTHGFVHYVPNTTAIQYNLTYASEKSAVLRVDTTEQDASTGRFSVRISSKKQYDQGLFVFDVKHAPYGCSTWNALWLADETDWPANGEIDVIESVNRGTSGVQSTLHTTNHCKMSNIKRHQTGQTLTTNCWNATDSNAGCGVQGPQETYGSAFNAAAGGIYACELRSAGIRIWFFPRDNIPSDIPSDITNTSAPDPSNWPTPLADFPNTHCDINRHFRNQSIIANIDLCGDWAGAASVYSGEGGCPGTCAGFVAGNATAFGEAFWEWGGWRVYSAR